MQFRSGAPRLAGVKALIALVLGALLLVGLSGCGGAEARKARYVESGKKFLDQGNYEKARVEFSNAAQIDPKDANTRYLIGTVAEKLNNPREAVGQYQAALDADPNSNDARAGLARLYMFGGLLDKSSELVDEGLKQKPSDPKLLVVRAALKARKADLPGALIDAEQAYKLTPDDPYAIALLATLYRSDGKLDRAFEVVTAGVERLPKNVDLRVVLADLAMASNKPEEAESQLKKTIELEPAKMAHRVQLARFYMLNKNVDGAERTLREAVAAVPKEQQSEARLAVIEFVSQQRGLEAAAKQVEAYLAEVPKDTSLRLAIAAYYERHGNKSAAQAAYREVVQQAEVKADGLAARNRLAAMAVADGDIEGATKLINETLTANARDADALILRGNIALARGDATQAITDLRSVLRDQPNSIPVMRALARAHLQKNEVSLAEETLRSAVQVNPKDQAARLDLAQLLAQTGRNDAALTMLHELVEESPTNMAALELQFRLYAAQRKFDEARRVAMNAQAAQPDHASGYYLLGMVDEAEQKTEAARAAYQRALDRQPAAAEPLTALVRLDIADKNPDRALARIEQLLVREPKHAVAYNLQGEILTSRKQFENAAASFRKSIGIAPTWWVPYRGLSLAELGAQRRDGAIEALRDGIAKAQGAQALTADLAALQERLGHSDEAIKAYEDLARREPASQFAANNLAMLLVNYRDDKASLDRALQLADVLANSEEPSMLNTRGWVKFKSGDVRAALPLLQQAVEKAPNSPQLRYHLGMAQLKNGERAEARKNLEAAVGAGQAFFGVDEAKATLAQLHAG